MNIMIVLMASYYRPLYLLQSLWSLKKTSGEYDKAFVYDNNSDQLTKNVLKKYASNVEFGDVNIGKAKAINSLFIDKCNGNEFICSLDSDIVVQKNIFNKAKEILYNIDKPCIIAADHIGNSAHLYFRNRRALQTLKVGRYELIRVKGARGVAGGCLFMAGNTFLNIGGYTAKAGIYGGNEAGLFAKFMNIYGEDSIYVCPELKVYHPPENDKAYAEWKVKCQSNIRSTGHCKMERGFYKTEEEIFNGSI